MSINPIRGDKAPSSNDHVLRMALKVLTFPWVMLRGGYRVVCRLFKLCRSEREDRDADKLRQSRARRTLRGLPADHVHDSAKPS